MALPTDAAVARPCTLSARARFAIELLNEEGVAATPGIDFGRNRTARHLRFAFTRPQAELEEALRRIRRFCARRS